MPELRPGWQRVKFGEVVRLVKARSADPLADGIERYVGLEHIEPGDLRIRSWGDVAEGTTFTTRFRPGQVLFGKRRAYQRKVAVADFHGVCSGDIYVLESADPSRLLPDLLPFICQTDAFFEHAVGTSAGSLSPRTNWTSLADHEVRLPPLKEQQQVVERLTYTRELVASFANLVQNASALEKAYSEETMREAWSAYPRQSLPSLCDVLTVGIVVTPAKYYVEAGGIPVLRSLNVWPNNYVLDDVKTISVEGHRVHSKSALRTGDIVMVRTGDPGRPGNAAVVPPQMDGWNCVDLVLARPSGGIVPEYIAAFINWSRSARLLAGFSPGTKQKHLSVNELTRFEIPVPSIARQQAIAATQRVFLGAVRTARHRWNAAVRMHKRIMEATLSGIISP